MSYSIDGTKIKLTRGDTFRAQIEIMIEDEVYTPVDGDSVRFALKHKELKELHGYKEFIDEDPLVIKSVPIDTMILELEPDDTKHLLFGKYKYDLEITFANGDVDTFVADAPFEITAEVH